MRSPVVISNTASASEADLLASHLRSQGIDAAARTHLDRSAYAGLGGATVLVPAEQRIEAELELMMLEESVDHNDEDAPIPGVRTVPGWIRLASYTVLAGMVVASVVPSLLIIWTRVFS